jgi:hypothetical protein
MSIARRRPKTSGLEIGRQVTSVFAEYLDFMRFNTERDDIDRARAFMARHTAARAAISHIDALLKLDAGSEPNVEDQQHTILAHARAALAEDRSENMSDDLEDED